MTELPRITPEEEMRRMKACLSEIGYPNADIRVAPPGSPPWRRFYWPEVDDRWLTNEATPERAAWCRAREVAQLRVACWTCWGTWSAPDCSDGRCPTGRTPVPRELLGAR